MIDILIAVALGMFGAILGSYGVATVWRLRAIDGERHAHDPEKLAKLHGRSKMKDRSICLHCGYQLRWYDLLPIVSWVVYRGKCRKCRKPIGWMEIAGELGLATLFVLSYIYWPFPLDGGLAITQLVIWLAALVVFVILALYDIRWYLLPNAPNYALIVLGLAWSAILLIIAGDAWLSVAVSVAGSLMILSGLYYVLYLVSRGAWIGFGDIILGVGLALLLGDWTLAALALFAANLLGTLLVLPGMLSGKMKRNSKVPFGPLLIAGTIIAQLFGPAIVDWYASTLVL